MQSPERRKTTRYENAENMDRVQHGHHILYSDTNCTPANTWHVEMEKCLNGKLQRLDLNKHENLLRFDAV